MPFQNYYVGSNLSDIGRAMQEDRGLASREEMARMENARLQQAALMQALERREASERQSQQFAQELALRQAAQQQQQGYQNQLFDLKKQEFEFNKNGTTPAQEWENTYRNQALVNALEIAKLNAGRYDPRVAEEGLKQDALNERDYRLALENVDAENSSANAKASEYNALANQIEQDIQQKQSSRAGEWFTTEGTAKQEAEAARTERFQALLQSMQADRRPGNISTDATGRRFVPILRAKPQPYPSMRGGYNPIQAGAGGQPANGVQGQAQGAASGGGIRMGDPTQKIPTPQAVEDKPIQVMDSTGRVFTIMARNFPVAKQRDPGIQIVTQGTPSGPSRAAVIGSSGPGGSSPATPQPEPYGILNSLRRLGGRLYNSGTDYLGNQAADFLAPYYDGAQSQYDELIKSIDRVGR